MTSTTHNALIVCRAGASEDFGPKIAEAKVERSVSEASQGPSLPLSATTIVLRPLSMHCSNTAVRRGWRCTLALALLLAAGISHCTARLAAPPPWFQSLPSADESAIELRAPAHLSSSSSDAQAQQQHFQSQALRRRAVQNANDTMQSLGLLSGAYDIPLNVSSPPQLVFVQLDTGSSDLWITSSRCSSSQCKADGVLTLDIDKSSSFRTIQIDAAAALNLTASSFGDNATQTSTNSSTISKRADTDVAFSIFYDDDTAAKGVLGADEVRMAGLRVERQAFALIDETNVTLGAQGISGVLGLGFPRGSTIARSLVGYQDQVGDVNTLPLATSLLRTNVSYPMFGLYLTPSGGRATFGAADPIVLPTGQDRSLVQWHDVVPFPSGDTSLPANATLNVDAPALGSYVQWVVRLTAAGVAGRPATLTPTYTQVGETLALIDSGSSAILGPAADVESLFGGITNSRHVGGGRFVVPCDTTARMYFSFGGRNITLLPQDYLIGPDTLQPYLCFAWPAASPPDATGVDWILGTPFLRATYALFAIGINDVEPPKVGFFPLRQPADATEPAQVFQPEPTQSVLSWVSAQGTKINSVLPNSLVSLSMPSRQPYFFGNATATPSAGVVPTRVGASRTYSPILPTAAAGTAASLPVVASSSPIPVPSNPAKPQTNAATCTTPPWIPAALVACILICTL